VPERLTEPSSVRRLEDRAGEEVSEGGVSILGSVLGGRHCCCSI